MTNETFSNNYDVISSNNNVIYLRLTQKQFEKRIDELEKSGIDDDFLNNYELTKIVFNERDKYLKKSSNITFNYDMMKLDDVVNNLEKLITG